MQRAPRDRPSCTKVTVAACFSSLVSNGRQRWLLWRTSEPTIELMRTAPLLPPVDDFASVSRLVGTQYFGAAVYTAKTTATRISAGHERSSSGRLHRLKECDG